LNARSDLFKAVILNVPFLDIVSTLLDDSLPLSVTDYLELGNPLVDEKIYRVINSYSPYENLSRKEYPPTLMTISVNDPRVPAWSSLKFVEKMRDMAKNPE
jgi:oligopeptidase B